MSKMICLTENPRRSSLFVLMHESKATSYWILLKKITVSHDVTVDETSLNYPKALTREVLKPVESSMIVKKIVVIFVQVKTMVKMKIASWILLVTPR